MHHCAPYHVRSTKISKLFSYSNVFVRYEQLFTNGQEWHLFKHVKPPNGYFAVVNLYVFEETCILLESLS